MEFPKTRSFPQEKTLAGVMCLFAVGDYFAMSFIFGVFFARGGNRFLTLIIANLATHPCLRRAVSDSPPVF
ncbi:hypothetical protein [Erwinia sp. JUb26]|uniref:hypothetical protein n=1 Tax=Erwinia sp. JUb26 TaxID=2485126 RepID=UPI0011CEB759|nr:hypothetical protein [Erwinia sp. JUb26]